MFGKKKLIILISVAIISFGGSFLVSAWLAGPSQPAQASAANQQPEQESLLVRNLAESGLGDMKPREKLLDEMIKSVRYKDALLREREKHLKQQEKRIKMAQQTLEKQARELEDLRTRLVVPVAALERVQADIKRDQIAMKQQEVRNLQKIAANFEKTDPTVVAKILTNMCADARYQDAVKILYLMSERATGKILGKIEDDKLASILVQQMTLVKQEGP